MGKAAILTERGSKIQTWRFRELCLLKCQELSIVEIKL